MKENKQGDSYRDTLREKRVQYHMTQAQVAEALGVSVITVGRWERGQAMPAPYCIKKLCQLFSATPAELGLELKMKQPSPATPTGEPAISPSAEEGGLPFSLEEGPAHDSFEKNHAEVEGSYSLIGVDVYPPSPSPLTPSPTSSLFPLRKRLQRPLLALVCIGLLVLLIIIWSDLATGAQLPFIHTVRTVAQTGYDATVAKHGVMFGFDAQHTHNNPFERILSPKTVFGLVTAWSSYPTGDKISSSPAVADGIVYVGSWDHRLYAYKAEGCGNNATICFPLWSSAPTGDRISSSPAVADARIYVGSVDGKLYTYNAKGCGNVVCPPLWSSQTTGGAIDASPVIVNGVVYITSWDRKLYAYSANGCGYTVCPPLWSSQATGGLIISSPAVANDSVYIRSYDGKVYAYNANGCGNAICSPLWSSQVVGGSSRSSPAVANGIVYVGSKDRRLRAYKADGCSGDRNACPPLWTSDPIGGDVNVSLMVANGIVSSPAVANGVVYVGAWDKKLYAYAAQGCGKSTCPPLWTSDATGDGIESSPTVANGVVYVGSWDHKLYAYNAKGCSKGYSSCPPLWSSEATGGIIFSSPTVANGVVYVGSYDGKLYIFHLPHTS